MKFPLGDYVAKRMFVAIALAIISVILVTLIIIPPLLTNSEEITPTIEIIRTASDPEAYVLLQQIENQTLPLIANWTYIMRNNTLEKDIVSITDSANSSKSSCTIPAYSLYWNVSVTRNETTLNLTFFYSLWEEFSHRSSDIYVRMDLDQVDLFFWWDNGIKTVIDPVDPYKSNITKQPCTMTWIFCALSHETKVCNPLSGKWTTRKQIFILDKDLFPVVFAGGSSTIVS